MEEKGMARRVDGLGRIVIPVEIRHALGISQGDYLELSVSGGRLICSKRGEDDALSHIRIASELLENAGVSEACRSEIRFRLDEIAEQIENDR